MLKRTVIGLVLSALAPAAGIAAEPPAIEFSGVFSAGGRTLLSLTDPATTTSQWIEPGHDFAGYAITAYNAAEDTIVLTKDGISTRLHLKTAKVQSAAAPEIGGMTREMQLMLWARIRGLEGEALISALVASGNADLKLLSEAYQRYAAVAASRKQDLDALKTESSPSPTQAQTLEFVRMDSEYSASFKAQEEIHVRMLQKAQTMKKALQEAIDR